MSESGLVIEPPLVPLPPKPAGDDQAMAAFLADTDLSAARDDVVFDRALGEPDRDGPGTRFDEVWGKDGTEALPAIAGEGDLTDDQEEAFRRCENGGNPL